MKANFRLPAVIALAALAVSCSGESGTSSDFPLQVAPDPVAATATVAIVLTDYAVDDYKHAWATITSVELMYVGDDRHTVFEGSEVVDLLALRDELKLFAVDENVEPGDISKIRLHASSLLLVKDDEEMTEVEAKLVGNGKIDLNPREVITLSAGDVVFLSLDWDMKESLKLTEAGGGKNKVIMRPVIFVDVGTEPAFKQGLVRVNGNVALIANDFSYFRICSTELPVQIPENPEIGDLCLDIVVNDNTGIFDPKGQPIGVDGLTKKDLVSVVGWLRRSEDGPTLPPLQDENGDVKPTLFQVEAIVVEGGDTWGQYRGTIQDVVNEMTFPFLVDDDMEGTEYTGSLENSTRIFKISLADGVAEIAPGDLMADDRAIVDAVSLPAPDEASPEILAIALMLARTPPDADGSAVGEIASINSDTLSLQLLTDSMELCVNTDIDTKFFELSVNLDSIETTPIEFGDLFVGSKALVTGSDENGCILASLIVAEAQASITQ